MLRCSSLLFSLLLLAPLARAEPLWTESKAGKSPRAIDMRTFIALARSLGPAVVNIIAITSSDEPHPQGSDANPERHHGRGQGTGFVIHKAGYVLTNSHVVDTADDIRVRLADDREVSARLIGKDERTDIALLKIEVGGDLAVAPLGDSDGAQIGEWVVAIGNPFGLDHTVTAGIISAKGRRDVRPGGAQTGFYDFIQTDASINPGNSGGPLINTRGEVIGINTAMNAQAQGIGFAIPINMAKVIAPLLRDHGRAPRSWLGLFPQPVNAALKRAFALPDVTGALVSDVVPRSPAEEAGVQTGDVVTEFDGHVLKRADDLTWLVATTPAGKTVSLSLLRKGKVSKVSVTLQTSPDEGPAAAPPAAPPAHKSPLGMTVSAVSAAGAEYGLKAPRGVVVMWVEPESPAVEAGIERGDVIVRVNERLIATLDDYKLEVRAAKTGDMIRILLKRDGHAAWVAFPKR